MLTKILKMHQNISKSSRAVIRGLPVKLIGTLLFSVTISAVGVLAFITIATSVYAQSISEEARKHMVRGEAALEMAKDQSGYENAIREFEEAVKLAPDWPAAYYNLGIVQEKAGHFEEAIKNLKKYLSLAPNAPDAEKVRNFMYKVEYKRDEQVSFYRKLSGTWEVVKDPCQHSHFMIDDYGMSAKFRFTYESVGGLKVEVFSCNNEDYNLIKDGGTRYRRYYHKWGCLKTIDTKGEANTVSFTYKLSINYPYDDPNYRGGVFDIEFSNFKLTTNDRLEGFLKGRCGEEAKPVVLKRLY